MWEKFYALKIKNGEEAKIQATEVPAKGFDFKSAVEYLMHCKDRGISVYIDFGKCKLYSCKLNFYTAYLQFYGLSQDEYDTRREEYKHATFEELESITKKYEEIKKKNIQNLTEQEQEERRILKKYYPEFADKLEEIENAPKEDEKSEISAEKIRRADEFFRILHPEFDELSQEEQSKLMRDKDIILENIDELILFYEKLDRKDDKENLDTIKFFIDMKKTEKYFKLMYPEYHELPMLMQFKLLEEQEFIKEHIDEIDLYYQNFEMNNTDGQVQEFDERKKIKEIVDNLKKRTSKEGITLQEIGEGTFYSFMQNPSKADKATEILTRNVEEQGKTDNKHI